MKNTVYIPPQRAMKKLKYARTVAETVYIGAATGYGKTELVRFYLKSRNYVSFSCETEDWSVEELQEAVKETRAKSSAMDVTVFVDDLQQLHGEECRKYLLSLAKEEGIWLILAGRSLLPTWLSSLSMVGELVRIKERDLALDAENVGQFLSGEVEGLTLQGEDAEKLASLVEGNPMALQFIATIICEMGVTKDVPWKMTDETRALCGKMFRDYLNTAVFPTIDPDIISFCMQVSVVDEFDVELAEYITGKARTIEMMVRLSEFSSGVIQTKNTGKYHFRVPMLRAFRERRDRVYDAKTVRELYYNAGLYYEIHDRILEAVDMYQKSGSDRIRNILVLNSEKNPASGFYYELKDCYLALPEEEILRSARLMSGMSMLCSLILRPEQSERWYRELSHFAKRSSGGEKAEAEVRLLCLDIALPQRGIGNLADLFKRLPAMVFNRGYSLPELSVTSNLPSMMNGGKDFSEWSRHDRALASSIGKVVERALGRYGRGLVPLALAESQFEKGGDLTEIIGWISQGQMLAQNGGKIEMEFVAVGLLFSISCMAGRNSEAEGQLIAFRAKAEKEDVSPQMLRNIDAMQCYSALLNGDILKIEAWMRHAPDETKDFFVMERLLYLTMVRCSIVLGDSIRALSLSEKILAYAKQYDRVMVWMEVDFLMAVIYYRQKNEHWKEKLVEGLNLAGDYQFVNIVRREGAALLPLLQKLLREPERGGLNEKVSEDWLKRVVSETEKIARRYPSYLKDENARAVDFSKKDIDVLALQARGFSVSQIAGALDMKPETVRYHIRQNYRKLHVSSKSEAVLAARDIGLL
ncbi:MAG: LuxR C-terminal-related transcriptional regulator [Lachnospiraceae bacterium]|nr:LuxR C-terminal-related transcriptional regulator [Lachnospiraceae bacterium]